MSNTGHPKIEKSRVIRSLEKWNRKNVQQNSQAKKTHKIIASNFFQEQQKLLCAIEKLTTRTGDSFIPGNRKFGLKLFPTKIHLKFVKSLQTWVMKNKCIKASHGETWDLQPFIMLDYLFAYLTFTFFIHCHCQVII